MERTNIMAIKITSDSTCDLSAEQLKLHNIELFPLCISMGNQCLRDGLEITPDDIYAHVDAGGDICTTSALNPADYADRFAALSKEYDAVIHINISAEFSSCFQNAVLASQDFDNVYVVDSRNLSTGHGHVVLRAAELAESGMSAEDIVKDLNVFTSKVDASFILSRLDYMKKGGRCSSVVALGANLLHLRPCIEVVGGKMQVGKKYRGSFEKCVDQYVRDRLAHPENLNLSRIFITHSGVDESAIAVARKAEEDCASFQEILVTRAGCTISSHCGPGTLGILFIRK